ncbi:hypothetical protein [Natrinema salaciae]|uniref:hypothetical protein n=1 Tax=Natrinema salaciae TaxID=1186196 RepID=UPI000AFD6076|nr:hypothetical protein [Natrinema salaciae]
MLQFGRHVPLLFESAIDDFDLSTATLCSPARDDLEQARTDLIPLDGIVEYASHHDRPAHPETDDWVAIPLHERDSAELTGECVAFSDHSLHGETVVYDDGDGYDSIDQGAFVTLALAERVPFWHSDYAPENPPSYFDSQSPSASRHGTRSTRTRPTPCSTNSSHSSGRGGPARGQQGESSREDARSATVPRRWRR